MRMLKARTSHLDVLTLLINLLVQVAGHPQCLDFRAPFRPKTALKFCPQYSELGCCGTANDAGIRKEYDYIKSQSSSDDWYRCEGMVRELLCQKCSPYAAHIYDAEGTTKPRGFPGLCTDYCDQFYDKCQSFLWFLASSLPDTDVVTSKTRFCSTVALKDVDYCYPSLLTNSLLLRNLTTVLNPQTSSGCLCLEKLSNSLANPLWARHAGDGSGRLFVAEQKGRVRIYDTQRKTWKPGCFLDFTNKVTVSSFPSDERGFLGLAFHPMYSRNGRFFVYYSTRKRKNDTIPAELQGRPFSFKNKIVISELQVSRNDSDKADKSSERILLEVLQPYENHNGGELMFGVDGYLYVFIGDGGGAGDPLDAGQNKSLLHGKVLRLDVDYDPGQPYTIPPDNPFVDELDSRPEIYAYGIRNIWRCGLDRGDRITGASKGRIVCGDVGQNAYEEIDVLKKGANYGWRAREGFECYDSSLCGDIGTEELPIHAYSHRFGKSVTGGVFYRGCENPNLNGHYIYGDFVTSRLWSLTESRGVWTNNDVSLCGDLCQGGLVGTLNDFILSFGEDEQGEIYILTSASSASGICDGKLYKIIDPATRNDPSTCGSDLTGEKRIHLPQRSKIKNNDTAMHSVPLTAQITIRVRINNRESMTATETKALHRNNNHYRSQRRQNSNAGNIHSNHDATGQEHHHLSVSEGNLKTDEKKSKSNQRKASKRPHNRQVNKKKRPQKRKKHRKSKKGKCKVC